MPTIVIENIHGKKIFADSTKPTLLQAFQQSYQDWMHACGGKGRCTTCKVVVISGMENLGDLTAAEIRYRSLQALKENERLSCQATVSGDVNVAAPDQYKLPHISYSD